MRLDVEIERLDWCPSAGGCKETWTPKGRPPQLFAKLLFAVSPGHKRTICFEGVRHFRNADFGWILDNKVNVVFVVVEFHENQVQALGGKQYVLWIVQH